ncbi:prolyl 4-hydroxylase subunit alpha-2 [Drosophila ficusphila]|uniref:prolyl 4-hydroxylase subunit alpha-2 n=1 Tax=Drosophila ficusphila TaxID=30025 RepID=UPI0007E829C2|nr:prolyl 4-hydroxylase subunit alpha-2 [Drosophila ficusphila]
MRPGLSLLAVLLCLGKISVAGTEDQLEEESKERYSSSTVGLLKLLKVEEDFADNLVNYGAQLGKKVQSLRTFLSTVSLKLNRNFLERVEYVSNPLNAFSLLRRTHEDLPKWHSYFKKSLGSEDAAVLDDLVEQVPSKLDLMSAALGIQRIEKTYDLRIDDLAQGLLQDKQYEIGLSFRDLVALGRLMFEQRDYQAAGKWYRLACKREPDEQDDLINEVLGNPSEHFHRQYIKALFTYGTSLTDPSKSTGEAFFAAENSVASATQDNITSILSSLKENDAEVERELYQKKTPPSIFEIGCRGQYRPKQKLVCRYKFGTTPFLRLAPLKFEEISLDPYIAMHHEVLYDSDTRGFREQSVNMMNGYADHREDGTEIRETVARLSWWTNISKTRERINQRIKDMTGLNFSKTEKIQVANYGVGTYFKPHFDYTAEGFETPDAAELGDRLASIIFYASDVPQGGATVFPKINVTVFPRKGSSLFWFNLFDDGRPDIRSQHSVCPVINGDRWTLTKWIHLFPQMFTRPCAA